jgi:hypothetical protein
MNRTKIFLIVFIFNTLGLLGQNSFNGFNYQAVIKNAGSPIINQPVNLKIEIRSLSSTGVLLYDEIHNVTTNSTGFISLVIGLGSPDNGGLYPTFSGITWQDTSYFCNLLMWDGLQYNLINSKQIFAVPFALYSKRTAQPFFLNNLSDVDTAGISAGKILKWNGLKWIIADDLSFNSDSILFAYNSNHADYADTAAYALNAQNIIPSDTALYAFSAGTANFATSSNHAINSDSSSFSNFADVANFAVNTWRTTGNSGTSSLTNFIGTTDANDVLFKTNDTVRMTIKSNGRIGIGTGTPSTDFHVLGKNGLLFQGTFGTGTIPATGGGTRFMWYPKKAAFRGGVLDGAYTAYWDDIRIGNYSFAYGKNVRAEGICAVSMGELTASLSNYSAAIGEGCRNDPGSNYSFAAGHVSITVGEASVALGRGNIARGLGSAALGYHSEANGAYSHSFGYYNLSNGDYSTSMGALCQANHLGAFVYADASNLSGYNLYSTANNQFTVRASGGYIFYSNPAMTSGVTLAAGSGSWASLSDSTKKENFSLVNYQEILEKLKTLNVYTWNYKSQDSKIRHIGPTAQDFFKTFGLGENNTTINTVDIDGINMAAIKALAEKTRLLEKQSLELDNALEQIKQLKAEKELFKKELSELEKIILKIQFENADLFSSKK